MKPKTISWIIFIIGIIITKFTVAEWIDNFYVALAVSLFLINSVELIVQSKLRRNKKILF